MGVMSDFMEFLRKFGVIGLAIAFVIGGAVQKLISAIVVDVVMPLIGLVMPAGDWRQIVIPVGKAKLLIGDLTGTLIDFFIIAIVVFGLTRALVKEAPAK